MALLDPHYDVRHRAMFSADEKEVIEHICMYVYWGGRHGLINVLCVQVLQPLRLRAHSVSSNKLPYDERYTEFIEPTGLLPFIHMVTRSTQTMNPSAITALVDRWRPETHSFHLRTGEMTVTLQDMSMILALPIEGKPVCMDTKLDDWRGQMEEMIGKCPPERFNTAGEKLRPSAGATFTWIQENFKEKLPEDAPKEQVEQYARVYVWYIITRTLFPDGSGTTAKWLWLKMLSNMKTKWSWGSAALAFLYRQVIQFFNVPIGEECMLLVAFSSKCLWLKEVTNYVPSFAVGRGLL